MNRKRLAGIGLAVALAYTGLFLAVSALHQLEMRALSTPEGAYVAGTE